LQTAAEQREERIKFILEADVIGNVKAFLTSASESRQLAVRFIAELVKTGATFASVSLLFYT